MNTSTNVSVHQEVWNAKMFCIAFTVIYSCIAWWMPSYASLMFVLICICQIYLWFHVWVSAVPDDQVMMERHAKMEYLNPLATLLFSVWTGDSTNTLARGVSCCVFPFVVLSRCTSSQRVVSYCVVQLAVSCHTLQSHIIIGDPEGLHWLVLTLLTYTVAFDLHRRNKIAQESSARTRSSYEVLEKMLAMMCDGWLVLDSRGCVIGLDRKAASIVTADVQNQLVAFASMLHVTSEEATFTLQPGLEKLHMASRDEQCLEVECYTCNCFLSSDMLPLILGSGHILPQSEGRASSSGRYVLALRILGQTETTGASMQKHPGGPELLPVGPLAISRDSNATVALSQQHLGSEPKVEIAVSETSSTSGSGGANTNAKSPHLGHMIDLLIRSLGELSRVSLQKQNDQLSRAYMLIRRQLKRHVEDLLEQTQDQISALSKHRLEAVCE